METSKGKKRKNIAVYLPQIYSNYFSELRNSIEEVAKERGYRLVIFTCFGDESSIDSRAATNVRYDEGERSIFRIANTDVADGVLMLYDAFAKNQYEEIYDLVLNRYRCPIVNFRTPMEIESDRIYNVYVDDKAAFADMIQHFIDEHHCSKIDLVTGPQDNMHSMFRLDIYKEVLEQNGISVQKERIHWGNFWKNCGEGVVEEIQNSGVDFPEAIVCANDYMAISVTQALQARGIKVPAQVLVSGYDNVVESRFSKPSVTTIRQPMRAMGRKAFEILERCWAGEKVEQDNYLKEEIVYRQSCGCGAEGGDENGQYATKLSAELDNVLYLETAASAMVTMLANAMDMNEYTDCLKQYVLRETGFKSFALCLAEHWEQKLPLPEKNYGTSKCKVDMVMGIHKSKVLKPERFPICQMVPSEFARDADPIYVIPLHYLQQYMGYAVLQIDYDLVSNVNIKSWFIHLDSALENFRMKQRLHQVAKELESLYIQDTLTGLYNRRGLEKFGERMCEECIRNNGQFMIMEIDMDGLKQVNDRYGHEEGDVCITTIANAMMYAAKDGEICIRSGGDEYIVMGKNYSEEKTQNYIRLFREYIDSANASLNKPYTIGASLGYYMGVPDGKRTIENYLKIADDRMYENKKMRKAKSHPGVEVR